MGQWASYQVEAPSGDRRFVDLAIVGKRRLNGKVYYWCELTGEERGRRVILKQLIASDRQTTRDVLVQRAGQKPIALRPRSRVALDGGEGWHVFLQWIPQVKTTSEKRSLFAGSFQARHYKKGHDQYWFTDNVPILGLLEARTAKLGRMVLMAHGRSGARSNVKGVPVSVKAPRLGNTQKR